MSGVSPALWPSVFFALTAASPITLERPLDLPMRPTDIREATIALRGGQSAELAVTQQGIDVVVEVYDPAARLIDSIDSPNGRQGDEPVSIFAASGGAYRLRIVPISSSEPAGRISIRLHRLRSVAATRQLLAQRERERGEASAWLRRNSAPIASDAWSAPTPLPPFDQLVEAATIVGLGEATHGSRELGDVRLAMVQRLVERHGYRLVALEDSAARWRILDPYVLGRTATPPTELEWGWIGRRSRRALLEWVRQRNLAHPDDLVRVIGTDPQDNGPALDQFTRFIAEAFGESGTAVWRAHRAELAAADEQALAFGDSSIAPETRLFLFELVARLKADAALLGRRFGAERYREAFAAAQELAAMADFNAPATPLSRSRDWHMATRLLEAIDADPRRPKAIYWGHNAHVAAAATSWGPTGGLLRQALGCDYRAIATTFGEGGVLAQLPNDPDDRLVATTLPPAEARRETWETALAGVRRGPHIATWPCGDAEASAPPPAWLNQPRPMRWVGALYASDTPPSGSYRPYRLLEAFDAIVYLPKVTAEEAPADRPIVPPRPPRPAAQ